MLEVLIARDDEIGGRMRRGEFEERSIGRVAYRGGAARGLGELRDDSEYRQELKRRNSRVVEKRLQARTVQYFFELGKRGLAHDRNDAALNYGVDNSGWGTGAGD